MLLERIKTDSHFASYHSKVAGQTIQKNIIDTSCCENNICAEIDDSLSQDDYLIIKVDSYFQKSKSGNTPKGVDCLILVRGNPDKYCLYLIELKNEDSSTLKDKIDDIIEKFQHTIDFLLKEKKFAKYFNRIFENVQFDLISKVTIDSERNKRDDLLARQAYRNLLNKIYKLPLNPVKKTEFSVSINMKYRDTKKLIKPCK